MTVPHDGLHRVTEYYTVLEYLIWKDAHHILLNSLKLQNMYVNLKKEQTPEC